MAKHSQDRRPLWYLLLLQLTQPTGKALFVASLPVQAGFGYFFYRLFQYSITMQILTAAVSMIFIVLATERDRYLYDKTQQKAEEESINE